MARGISGLRALHDIDAAIAKARANLAKANEAPARISNSLAEINRKQARLWEDIAKIRIEEQASNKTGGELGYVDRQVDKLLIAHRKHELQIAKKAESLVGKISSLEAKRRIAEQEVKTAIENYEKSAAQTYKKLAKNQEYKNLEQEAKRLMGVIDKVEKKLDLAKNDVETKGEAYRKDRFFNYLQKRNFGTKQAKGWALTKWLDGVLAKRLGFREALLNYNSLIAIPKRIENHLMYLHEELLGVEQKILEMEANQLKNDGVTSLKNASLKAQKNLESIDDKIEQAEEQHQETRKLQAEINAGKSEPYQSAIELLVGVLKRKNLPDLRRIAAYTISKDDDRAIAQLLELSELEQDLQEEKREAAKIISGYRKRLTELENLRRLFKSRRYDAPSSRFPDAGLFGQILGQLLIGALNSRDVWRQIERAQRTIPGRGLPDLGGGDWGGARRWPRTPRRRGGFGGGWGGGFPSGGGMPRPPRPPRIKLPRSRGGGFRTGGGF